MTPTPPSLRHLLAAGRVGEVADRLGAPFEIRGTVVHGDRRGRTIGFPTANIVPGPSALLPAPGVYAGIGLGRPAVISVGVRPTFGHGNQVRVEVHLLDFSEDLYGSELSVAFLAHLRDERRFDGPEALAAQLLRDVDAARSACAAALSAPGQITGTESPATWPPDAESPEAEPPDPSPRDQNRSVVRPIVVLLGPPGAGKGTHVLRLAEELSIAPVGMGNLLRSHVGRGTQPGLAAAQHLADGTLVPDFVIGAILRHELQSLGEGDGLLLDGFPRTVAQAEFLERELDARGRRLRAAVYLEVAEAELVRRLSGRRTCSAPGHHVFHVEFAAPAASGVCDVDGSALVRREDDRPATIRRRVRVFEEQTRPVAEFYAQRGLLHIVDGSPPPPEVYSGIARALDVERGTAGHVL